jgi:hypothetical protein
MTDLFQQKAISKGFIIYFDQEKNIYSDTFELWCRKLHDLQPVDFKRAMQGLETKAEDDYRLGGEMWPPSYAEFRALAFPKTDRDSMAHIPFERLLAIEDQTAKAERYEIGMQKSNELLNMLGDTKKRLTPAQSAETQEFARKRLEQAKKLI